MGILWVGGLLHLYAQIKCVLRTLRNRSANLSANSASSAKRGVRLWWELVAAKSKVVAVNAAGDDPTRTLNLQIIVGYSQMDRQ